MTRPCERVCHRCKESKHHSRFHSKTAGNSTIARFSPICRDCEQKARNEKKNEDRPLAVMRERARTAARKAGVSADFVWTQLNYTALVPIYRASIGPEGLCLGCGHKPLHERDVQIEHCEPPRHRQDWARLHTRNIRLVCGSCNRTKGDKSFAVWLDEQEGARVSNLAHPTAAKFMQLPLWELTGVKP